MFKPNLLVFLSFPAVLITIGLIITPWFIFLGLALLSYQLLQWSFTRVVINQDCVEYTYGLINRRKQIMRRDKIHNIEESQSLLERICRSSTLHLYAGNEQAIRLPSMSQAKEFKHLLLEIH